MPSLPEEIVEEILVRLPGKSLKRFRCLKKSWGALIDEPSFRKSHAEKASKNKNYHDLLFINASLFSKQITFSLRTSKTPIKVIQKCSIPTERYVKFVGSCNGIICLSMSSWPYNIILWNPTIRESWYSPNCLDNNNESLVFPLAFDFGHDNVTDDYKVLRVIYYRDGRELMQVYSLKTNSWRKVNQNIHLHSRFCRGRSIFHHKSIHWIATEDEKCQNSFIVSFELWSEQFCKIELPENEQMRGRKELLGLLDEHISMIVESQIGCCIWVMKEYAVAESWTKLYTIPQFISGREICWPFGFTRCGKILLKQRYEGLASRTPLQYLPIAENGDLIMYDPKKKDIKMLESNVVLYLYSAHTHFETLLSVEPPIDQGVQAYS